MIHANYEIKTRLHYKMGSNPRSFNFVIYVNELNASIDNQNILGRLLRKSDYQLINQTYEVISKELFNKGYQLIIITYLNQNELIGPLFNHHHLYIQYPLRMNKYKLNRERKIISNAFKLLDEFVANEVNRRPLCIIFHLPSKPQYQLEKAYSRSDNF